jgi:hypothetical protein
MNILIKSGKLIIVLCLLGLFVFSGCKRQNRFDVDVDKISLKITIQRFDKDLFSIDTSHVQDGITKLHQKYGSPYMNLYFSKVMQLDSTGDARLNGLTAAFLKDTAVRSVFRESLRQYSNISDIEAKVTDAFKRIHYFFPEKKIPQLYLHVSMFNQSLVVDQNIISLSVDNYLGANYYWYKKVVYDYLRPNMCREKVASDFVTAYLMTEFPAPNSERFLDNMLFRGKMMFALSVLMPKEKPETLMGYTKAQMDWCSRNEKSMWLNIMDGKQLYSSDPMMSNAYLNDAPFTSIVSQDSPGRVGTWIGWQIVKQYMEHHQDVTLQALLADNNYQQLLEQSGYKP